MTNKDIYVLDLLEKAVRESGIELRNEAANNPFASDNDLKEDLKEIEVIEKLMLSIIDDMRQIIDDMRQDGSEPKQGAVETKQAGPGKVTVELTLPIKLWLLGEKHAASVDETFSSWLTNLIVTNLMVKELFFND